MPALYRKLTAWQRADDLFIEVHQLTRRKLPPFEQYELARQIRRAAYSVPANLAEGNTRARARDAAHFFNVAAASLAEVGYGLHAAGRLGYLVPADVERLESLIERTAAPIHGLSRSRRTASGHDH